MKRIIIYILFLCFLYSCNNSNRKSEGDKTASLNLTQKFAPLLQGTWVIKGYINDLKKTGSPYKSSGILADGGIVSVLIDTSDIDADSCDAGVSLNNHEGSDFHFYFRNGIKGNGMTLPANITFLDSAMFVDMGIEINGQDTTLVMYYYNDKKKLVDSVSFIKVLPDVTDDAGRGIQFVANKLLFSGKYSLSGTSGDNITVSFDDYGKMIGWDTCTDYYVATDYIANDTIDYILIGKGDLTMDKSLVYGYIKTNDSVKLFETSQSKDGNLVIGDLRYVLKKIE